VELSGSIKDLEVRIRQREDQLMYLRKELEGARYSNQALHENNATMQNEVDSMNNHIRVVSGQNDQLTREIDQFVQANEMIRAKLDRRSRVEEIKHRNITELRSSEHQYRNPSPGRSPMPDPVRPSYHFPHGSQ
jgi:chromosome segregation ATPase